MFRAGVERADHEALATLGSSLVLLRWTVSIGDLTERHISAWGATDIDEIHVVQTDGDGRLAYVEQFAPDQLADAVVRLYERYAESLPAGPRRERAVATARSVARTHRGSSVEFRAACAPDVRFHDHRLVGVPDQLGPDEFVHGRDSLLRAIEHVSGGYEDVLALEPDGHVVRTRITGVDRATGGAVELEHVMMSCYDDDGLLAIREFFPVDAADAALARFDEARTSRERDRFADEPVPAHRADDGELARAPFDHRTGSFDAHDEFLLAETARDWTRARSLLRDDFVFRDHRRSGIIAAEQTADEWVRGLAALARLSSDYAIDEYRTLAADAHGRVELTRLVGTQPDGGDFERDLVGVYIVAGRHITGYELFDLDDVDRALARFEELRP